MKLPEYGLELILDMPAKKAYLSTTPPSVKSLPRELFLSTLLLYT